MPFNSFGNSDKGFRFLSEKHSINVIDIDHYTSEHKIEGINLRNAEDLVGFSVRDNCSLESLDLNYLENGKKRKVKLDKTLISSTLSYGSFFNGQKTYFVPVKAYSHFVIEYTVKELNTIFITSIDSSGYYQSDEIEYAIHIPDGLKLSIQQLESSNQKDFLFTKADFNGDKATFYLLVLPEGEKETEYFSNWMEDRIKKTNLLKTENIPTSLIEISKLGDKKATAEACFKYIQNEIRYLDIENGVNALVPRPCNFVLENKYGDCKDMANALVSLLNHFGLEAYNCISRTNQKPGILDFPTVSKANHMIAGLKLDGNWIFLDATEENCRFGDPSMQILGTEAFAIGYRDGNFLKVPESPTGKAYLEVDYQLDLTNYKISIELLFFGKTNTLLFDQRNDPEVFDRITANLFSYSLPLIKHSITDTISSLNFEGTLPKAFVTQLANKQILQTNFLAEMKSLILSASYARYPLYPFSVESNVKIENISLDVLQVLPELWIKSEKESGFKMKQNWTSYKSQKEFEESDDWKNYKSKSVKPILIHQ